MEKTFSETSEGLTIAQNGDAKLAGTLTLLKVLALGNREIEQRYFRSAADVFANLEKEDA